MNDCEVEKRRVRFSGSCSRQSWRLLQRLRQANTDYCAE